MKLAERIRAGIVVKTQSFDLPGKRKVFGGKIKLSIGFKGLNIIKKARLSHIPLASVLLWIEK